MLLLAVVVVVVVVLVVVVVPRCRQKSGEQSSHSLGINGRSLVCAALPDTEYLYLMDFGSVILKFKVF